MELQGAVDTSVMLGSGVYALIFRREVVYVGKSTLLLKRLYYHQSAYARKLAGTSIHWKMKAVRFDSFYVWACPAADLDRLEREKIAMYRPRHNTKLVPKVPLPQLVINGVTIGGPSRPLQQMERRA